MQMVALALKLPSSLAEDGRQNGSAITDFLPFVVSQETDSRETTAYALIHIQLDEIASCLLGTCSWANGVSTYIGKTSQGVVCSANATVLSICSH